MSNSRPQAPARLSEATAWFARLGNRSITTQSLREFRQWRQDPANDAAYQEVEAAWTKAGALADDPDVMRATDAALVRRAGPRKRAWLSLPRLGWTLALATAGLVAGAIIVSSELSPSYATEVGEQRLVRLEDGSRVHLNTDSRVKVDFSSGQRRLVLTRGEALFDVAHDPGRPFIVDAGDASVRAVGTKFDVRRDGATVRVTLLEGAVHIRRDDEPRTWALAPNQQLTVTRAGVSATRATDAERATSWTTGRLVFRETPLRAAIAEVNRYAEQKVELEANGVGDRLVNGVFDVGDTDSFVKGVSALFDLKPTTAPNGAIRLQPAGHAEPA